MRDELAQIAAEYSATVEIVATFLNSEGTR